MGKLLHFAIELSHPDCIYRAGQEFSGTLKINLARPMKMKSLSLQIKGVCDVFWKTPYGEDFLKYEGHECYLHYKEVYLADLESGSDLEHPAGCHAYPFTIVLKPTLPTSFRDKLGSVNYWVAAVIEKNNHLMMSRKPIETTKTFYVIRELDLTFMNPTLLTGITASKTRAVKLGCLSLGSVTASFNITHRGYLPGEDILINGEVQNNSNINVKGVSAVLIQLNTFEGKGWVSHENSHVTTFKKTEDIMATVKKGAIPSQEWQVWERVPMTVPSLPASRLEGCRIINVSYIVQFRVHLRLGSDIIMGHSKEVFIGTTRSSGQYYLREVVICPPVSEPVHTCAPPLENPSMYTRPTAPIQDSLPPQYYPSDEPPPYGTASDSPNWESEDIDPPTYETAIHCPVIKSNDNDSTDN